MKIKKLQIIIKSCNFNFVGKRFNQIKVRFLLFYLKELLFVDEDAEAAAADNIDE